MTPHNPQPSARARILERRTYLRPLNDEGTEFETHDQMVARVIGHQRWLWEQQIGRRLNSAEEFELHTLREYMDAGLVSLSGRVKWMGGTDVVKERASAAFNCSFTKVEIPADLVDVFWLLLQGCGVGFRPIPGMMTGLPSSITEVKVVPSTRTAKGGQEDTTSTFEDGVWTIKVGDSARAWALALGKLLTDKYPAQKLVIDLSALRPGGQRLRGYGWLCSGWEPLAKAFAAIIEVLRKAGDALLTAIDIGDLINWLGTVLSSRRSAQIWLLEETHAEIEDFVDAKVDRYELGNAHREQSNNSIMFQSKPERARIVDLLERIERGGDPGFVNLAEMKRRAPDAEGCNPCGEILLPNKGFCNLVQVVWHRFNGDLPGLMRAQALAARANYRQTCVSMKDGVLQLTWNDSNKLLRLCGVSPTGYVSWEYMNNPIALRAVRDAAIDGANSMADQLGLPRPRRVTQVQPAGTSSKVLGHEGDEVHEGAHCSSSRFIFNNINFSRGEPLVEALRAANYLITDNPLDPTAVLARIPVEYPDSPLFTKVERDGEILEINQESAISQLERYRILMENYVDNNCSITISFDVLEIDEMADWFMKNWDSFVGVSFLQRNDPTKTAEDLGFAYLPQECVSERTFRAYADTLLPVDLTGDKSHEVIDLDGCVGSCPIR